MAALQLIKYILLQITIGPSIICDLVVFIYFIIHWRKAIIRTPQNHVILCLLIAVYMIFQVEKRKTKQLLTSLYAGDQMRSFDVVMRSVLYEIISLFNEVIISR